jgi:hypothetical protein
MVQHENAKESECFLRAEVIDRYPLISLICFSEPGVGIIVLLRGSGHPLQPMHVEHKLKFAAITACVTHGASVFSISLSLMRPTGRGGKNAKAYTGVLHIQSARLKGFM